MKNFRGQKSFTWEEFKKFQKLPQEEVDQQGDTDGQDAGRH